MEGSVSDALGWRLCPRCGNRDLLFAAPLDAQFGHPTQAGTRLSEWQAQHGIRPAPTHNPLPVQPSPGAAPPLPGSIAGPKTAGRAGPSPVAGISPGRARPPRRGPIPQAKQPSKTLIVVRLLVAGVAILVAGVVVVVWVLTKDSSPTTQVAQQNQGSSQMPSSQRAPAGTTPRQSPQPSRADQTKRAESLCKSALENSDKRAAELRNASQSIRASGKAYYEALANRTASLLVDAQTKRDELKARETELKSKLTAAESARDEAEQAVELLREKQLPLARFLVAYERVRELQLVVDEKEAAWRASSKAAEAGRDALEAAERQLDNATDEKERAELERRVFDCDNALTDLLDKEDQAEWAHEEARDSLLEADEEAVLARAALSAGSAESKRMLDALSAYDATGKAIAKAKSQIADIDSAIAAKKIELKDATAVAVQKKAIYDAAHDDYRAAAQAAGNAKANYKNQGGASRKAEYERLQEEADRLEAIENAARRDRSDADNVLKDIKKEIRKLERDQDGIREQLAQTIENGKSLKAAADKVASDLSTKILPGERARLEELAGAQKTLDDAKSTVSGFKQELTDVSRSLADSRKLVASYEDYQRTLPDLGDATLKWPLVAEADSLASDLESFTSLKYLTAAQAARVSGAASTLIDLAWQARGGDAGWDYPGTFFTQEIKQQGEAYRKAMFEIENIARAVATSYEALWTNLSELETGG